jgi:hypothetical protein
MAKKEEQSLDAETYVLLCQAYTRRCPPSASYLAFLKEHCPEEARLAEQCWRVARHNPNLKTFRARVRKLQKELSAVCSQ